MSLVAHKYTPAEMSEQELEATFTAREHTVDYLLDSLRKQIKSGTLSSFLVTGPRGAGKSTIIQIVALRINKDRKLNAAWIPIVFPEEQFNIGSLRDLMANALQILAKEGFEEAQTWLEKVEAEPNEEQSLQHALTGLRKITRDQGKRLILFIENLNLLLEDSLDDQMKATFRRLLMSDPFMMVIGSAVHDFEALKNYDEAFFNYFGEVPLGKLSAEDVFDLLRRRALFDNNQKFLTELPRQQSKIRAIVHLSGGNPRLILMLYELLTQRQVSTIVQCLQRLVDELTPLLKHEIENLPPQQRKIIHALMEEGGTSQPSRLVERTRLPLNAITTQLGRLKDAQLVEVAGGGKGRTANYSMPDKLFSIWYQMRYLKQNRRRIEMFVEVLRVWFEEEERLATLRELGSQESAGAPQVLNDASTSEYFAASLRGTHHERVALALCMQQWVKVSLEEAALAYADLCADSKRNTLLEPGQTYSELGELLLQHSDFQSAIRSFDKAIANDPQNVKALLSRGIVQFGLRKQAGAIHDFNAVIEIGKRSSTEAIRALVWRGLTRLSSMELDEAISDFTAVLEKNVPKWDQLQSLIGRGIALYSQKRVAEAMNDWLKSIQFAEIENDFDVRTTCQLYVLLAIQNDNNNAKQLLAKFGSVLNSLPVDVAHQIVLLFLYTLALPRMKDLWPTAWRNFANMLTQEVAEPLYLLEPVCRVLEGESRAILDSLPSQQREFVETVLKKFEPEQTKTS